jgi:predicted Rossmann-fold nucleotide-binding protein
MEEFDGKFSTNSYHRHISNMKIATVWTTNYDDLLEQAYSSRKFHVISCDDDLGKPRNNNQEIEIIKIHGCIKHNLDEIVLTQQDYDEITYKKPAITQKLKNSLIHNSILFLGYSYQDRDIRAVMIEAMELMNKNTQEHFMILLDLKAKEKDKQQQQRDKLWLKELNRIGIRVFVVNNTADLDNLLKEISLKSRGKNVFVTGSHTETSKKSNEFASKLGSKLAKAEGVVLINGQSEGIGMNILKGFMEQCISDKKEMPMRIKFYPNPYTVNPEYANRIDLFPLLKKERCNLFADVKTAIFFSGGMGTKAELEIAQENNCEILPVILSKNDYDNDVLKTCLKDEQITNNLHDKVPEYWKILKSRNRTLPTQKQIMDAIEKMID